MQLLLNSADPHAAEAVNLFAYRIIGEMGMLAAIMGGVDAIVLTAGIGENAPQIRSRICAGFTWMGASIDEAANSVDLELIHTPASTIRIAIIPTDEEKMIALHTQYLIGQSGQMLHMKL
jgi:acetate kinase